MSSIDRAIHLESVQNMRDFGGLPNREGRAIRSGRLFRADGVHRLTPNDIERIRALGLQTVIDLRSESELAHEGTFPHHLIPVDFVHVPTIDEGRETFNPPVDVDHPHFLAFAYMRMIENNSATLVRSLTAVANACHSPTLFHCTVGKDRTGVLSMLILGILGVDHATIIDDYSLSNDTISRMRAWNQIHQPEVYERQKSWPERMLNARPGNMELLIDSIVEKHGSIRGLVSHWGVDDQTMEKLHDHLLV